MNTYITFGTTNYLMKVKAQFQDELMLMMVHKERPSLLLHETRENSVFKEGKSYEIVEQIGILKEQGFAVLNNIPVLEEGRSLFEYQLFNRVNKIEMEHEFVALRILRPQLTTRILSFLYGKVN